MISSGELFHRSKQSTTTPIGSTVIFRYTSLPFSYCDIADHFKARVLALLHGG